jgi:hypothetical protein
MPEKPRPARQRQAKLDAKAKIKEQARLDKPLPGAGVHLNTAAILDKNVLQTNGVGAKDNLTPAAAVAMAAAKGAVKPADAADANEGPDAYPPPAKVLCDVLHT